MKTYIATFDGQEKGAIGSTFLLQKKFKPKTRIECM